jgi:hypothetical protein
VYTLDFETMKQVMQEHQKTGFLLAETPSGVRKLRGPCRIEIMLKAGGVVSCTLVGSKGGQLTGKDAVQALAHLGRLRWTFTPEPEAISLPMPARPAFVAEEKFLFPQHSVWPEQKQMRSWPRMHRAVFALADGTKNVAKIAEILSTSSDVVDGALRDLQSIGAITMGPQYGQDRSGHL